MTTFGTDLNEDSNGLKTSSTYGDRGDGVNGWAHFSKVADGGDVTVGAQADAAVTNPATAASVVAILKGVLTLLASGPSATPTGIAKLEDAAHASGDAGIMALGVRNDARATLSGTTLDYTPPAMTADGTALVAAVPTSLAAWAATRVSATASVASLVVKNAAGKLYKLYITNGGTAQFFQIYNTASLPADGAVPVHCFRLGANETREIDFTEFGDLFTTGITVSNSSTLATKTIGAADSFISALFI